MQKTKKNILSYSLLISFIVIGTYFYIKDYSISKIFVKQNTSHHESNNNNKTSFTDNANNSKDFNSVMLANIAGQMEVPAEAAKYTEEALKNAAEEDKFKIYYNLAKVYEENLQSTQAIEVINKAIKHNPKCWTCYNLRGLSNLNLRNIQQSLADFNKSIELSAGKEAAPFQNRYLIYNNYIISKDQAISDLKMAIKLDPQLLQSYTSLFLEYNALYKYNEMKLLLEQFNNNFNLKEPEYQAISWFFESYIHIYNSNYNEGLNILKKSVEEYIRLIKKNHPLQELEAIYITIRNITDQLYFYRQYESTKKLIDLGYKIEKLRNEEKLKIYLDKMSERLHYKSKYAREVEVFRMETND